METQAHVEMTHGETPREERTRDPAEELTEERFLKDLYLYMKKRDTPIERIPHLGFKQIDLFLMFKTVRDLGGYQQVTAQQLWKQVYNRLGGNPRSTSAATCTRRHYEKLLLPYECHVKGIVMSALPPPQPQPQPKHFHYASYLNNDGGGGNDDDGQRAAKRKLLSIHLHQSPHNLQSDPHGSGFPLPFQYSRYYPTSHSVRPRYVAISSEPLTSRGAPAPAPKPQFALHPSSPGPADRVKEPLEHLRLLAEQYKNSSGLAEPLNLSVKAPSREADRNPASSFAPPSSYKNPKFLNKPSPLYASRCAQAVRNEVCETQDAEEDAGVPLYSYPVKARDLYVFDVRATTASGDAATPRVDRGATATATATAPSPSPGSPKTDLTLQPKEEREGSPDARGLNLSHILPGVPRDYGGKMEIEIPLSMLHNWLRLCGSSAVMHGDTQLCGLPTQDEPSGQRGCSDTDAPPASPAFHINPQCWSPAAEDLRLRRGRATSPAPAGHSAGQNHFTGCKPWPSGADLRDAPSRDAHEVDGEDIIKSCSSNPPTHRATYDRETQASYIKVKMDSRPLTTSQDPAATKSYDDDPPRGGRARSETEPAAMLMLNSSSASLLQLTTEEVMKLKKIISSSS